jgi:hypothetical protein
MRVNARICFYNFKELQGWRYYFIRLLSWSHHTHAHLEFDLNKPFAYVVIDGKEIRALKLGLLQELGITKYYEFDIGCLEMGTLDIMFASSYKRLNSKSMIIYQLFGRFFGMKRPSSCVTFICDYLKFKGWDIPDLFSPQELWESLHADNNDRWKGPRGQNNTSQVAQ